MMKYVRFILVSLMLLSAALLLAWPAKPREAVPEGFTEIRYWEKWAGMEADAMKQIVDEFNATRGKEKKIYVSYLSLSGVDQKTLLATAAGVPPDVAGFWDHNVASFAGMGALEPLDQLAREYQDYKITRDYYKPVFWDGCSYEGKLYALPSTPGVVALHYNKAVFRKKAVELRAAGLDPNRPPQSIDELDRYAAVLDTRDPSGRLISAGYLPQEPGWWSMLMPYWFGSDMYDPVTRKISFTNPKVVQAYEWMQGYTKKLGADSIQQFLSIVGKDSFDSPLSPFFTGAVAMEQEGAWKANYIQKNNQKMANIGGYSDAELKKMTLAQRRENADWGAAPFPSMVPGEPPVTYASMDVLTIPSSSKHKKEAFEFIAFVNRQDIMEKLISMHCKDSPLAKMSDAYIANHPNPYVEVFESLAASPNAKPLPPMAVWPEVGAELTQAIDVLCRDTTKKPIDQLAIAEKRAQQIIDRYFMRADQRARLAKQKN